MSAARASGVRLPRLGIAALLLCSANGAVAQEKGTEQVSPFFGSFSQSVPIQVPPFHGLEPRLALGYSSEGRNGFVGVGWSLAGFSTIQRVSAGRGTPRFDATDLYTLDGQLLLPCAAGSTSPSCTTGGTHFTREESYLRISYAAGANQWSVWGKDGTKTTFSSLLATTATYRWGQTQAVDTKTNTVAYSWSCLDNDCYPSSVSYGPYVVTFYRESRPDVATFAFGSNTSLGQTTYRLRSILVALSSSPIRAYKLTYAVSAASGRSLLGSVQTFGRDVVIDGSGSITGGSTLPARTFGYQTDPNAATFRAWPGGLE